MLSEFVLDPLRGRTRLWRVLWLYIFVVGASLRVLELLLLPDPAPSSAVRLFSFAVLLVTVYQLIAIWRCANNNPSPFFARFVRLLAILGFLVIPLFVYLLIMDPTGLW